MPKSETSETQSEEKVSSSDEESADEIEVPKNKKNISDYEKQRLQRIEENQRRMEALGLPKMASNFMGSVLKSQKKSSDKKGKRKIVDEDEEYNPTIENEDMRSSEDDDENDEDFSPLKKTKSKIKKNSSTPKKRVAISFDSDFVDDDDALMQAIALSLQDTETSNAHLMNPEPPAKDERKESPSVRDGSGKKKGRKQISNRVHMNEDEMLIHFFQFDESGRGSITLRDVERLAAVHDFTWSEKEMADMIYCFDSDGVGKINFDDFRKIVVRCNMLKASEKDATGR